MNKYTRIAEDYWNLTHDAHLTDCRLKTCLQEYGGGDNRHLCEFSGHIFCYCSHCEKHPTCLRCRLFMENDHYL